MRSRWMRWERSSRSLLRVRVCSAGSPGISGCTSSSRAARARCAPRCATTARTARPPAMRRRSPPCGSSAPRCWRTRSRWTSRAQSCSPHSPMPSRFRHTMTRCRRCERAAASGCRLAVIANWDCSLAGVLERLGLAEPFAAIVTAAEVGAAKPDPRPFQVALERLGVDAGRALHVGDDAVTDVVGAQRRRSDRRPARPQRTCARLARRSLGPRGPAGASRMRPPVATTPACACRRPTS